MVIFIFLRSSEETMTFLKKLISNINLHTKLLVPWSSEYILKTGSADKLFQQTVRRGPEKRSYFGKYNCEG